MTLITPIMPNTALLKRRLLFFTAAFFIIACSNGPQKQASREINATPAIPTDTNLTASGTKSLHHSGDVNNEVLSEFIPSGYSLLDSASGNLNLDSLDDMILVLKKNGEDSTSDVSEHPEKRPLLILTANNDGSYELAARNDNTVYCVDCGGVMGDPYMDVVIRNGFFSIEHYGGSSWRWTRIITYKYSPADKGWLLFKDGNESFHSSDPGKVERKILTSKDFGKVEFEDFDIYKEQ
jgi:hypothetical protein